MRGETKMSIAVNEAVRIFGDEARPDPLTERFRRTYVRGRTAKPCDEQIDAVADALSDLFGGDDTGFHRNDGDWKRTAKYLLNIARIEVM